MKSTTKEYLLQIHRIDIRIKQRMAQLDQMRERLNFLGSFDYSKDRVQVSPESGNRQIEKIVDAERELVELIKHEQERRGKIISEIQSLDNSLYGEILYHRYVEWFSFERIAVDMGYSYNYICTLHGEALNDFRDKILKTS